MGWGNFLKEGRQGGLHEEVEYEQKHQAIKSVRHENNSRKEVLGSGNSRCKVPEVGTDTALQGKARRPLWLQHVPQNCEWGEEVGELETSQSTKSTGEELELILRWLGQQTNCLCGAHELKCRRLQECTGPVSWEHHQPFPILYQLDH